MYVVHYAVSVQFVVKFVVGSLVCAVYCVHSAVCSVLCAVCSVLCALFSVLCALCSVQCSVCCVQCYVCSVQCAVCSAQCAVPGIEVQCSVRTNLWFKSHLGRHTTESTTVQGRHNARRTFEAFISGLSMTFAYRGSSEGNKVK